MTVHLKLNFNDKILSIGDDITKRHQQASFWLAESNTEALIIFADMHGWAKINTAAQLGKLIAVGLIQICA